jgi:teichuronic acid biosynthesis glycosyltransferase TuaC
MALRNLLMVVTNYPNAGHPYSGAFNERSARALKNLGYEVEVLAPRPYVPRAVARWNARWRAYHRVAEQEIRNGIEIFRPPYLQVPLLGGALRQDFSAYLSALWSLRRRHEGKPFDAVLGFNLIGAGGLAWRLGRRLRIPAAGWALGNEVRVSTRSAHGRAVRETLQRLDLVLYQSAELRACAELLSGPPANKLSPDRHVVLPHGIGSPPALSVEDRRVVRAKLNINPEQCLVLFVGRIVKAKGVFELIEAVALARRKRPDIVCVMVGALPGFDDAEELRRRSCGMPDLVRHVQILPGCAPDQVWRYLAAADLFAFPSHSEGMPNSLLEAMAVGVPAVAYAIPPIIEIDRGLGVLQIVPVRDVAALARALIELASSTERRRAIGEKGKAHVLGHYQSQTSMAEAMRRLSLVAERAAKRASWGTTAPLQNAGEI